MADLNAGWLRMKIGKSPNGHWILSHDLDLNNTLRIEIDHNFAGPGTDVVKFVHWSGGQNEEFRRDEQWAEAWNFAYDNNLDRDLGYLALKHSPHQALFLKMVAQWETLQMFVDFEVCSPVYVV